MLKPYRVGVGGRLFTVLLLFLVTHTAVTANPGGRRVPLSRYWKCALCGHMSRFTQELSRYRKKNAFQTLPELAQEVGVRLRL